MLLLLALPFSSWSLIDKTPLFSQFFIRYSFIPRFQIVSTSHSLKAKSNTKNANVFDWCASDFVLKTDRKNKILKSDERIFKSVNRFSQISREVAFVMYNSDAILSALRQQATKYEMANRGEIYLSVYFFYKNVFGERKKSQKNAKNLQSKLKRKKNSSQRREISPSDNYADAGKFFFRMLK